MGFTILGYRELNLHTLSQRSAFQLQLLASAPATATAAADAPAAAASAAAAADAAAAAAAAAAALTQNGSLGLVSSHYISLACGSSSSASVKRWRLHKLLQI